MAGPAVVGGTAHWAAHSGGLEDNSTEENARQGTKGEGHAAVGACQAHRRLVCETAWRSAAMEAGGCRRGNPRAWRRVRVCECARFLRGRAAATDAAGRGWRQLAAALRVSAARVYDEP